MTFRKCKDSSQNIMLLLCTWNGTLLFFLPYVIRENNSYLKAKDRYLIKTCLYLLHSLRSSQIKMLGTSFLYRTPLISIFYFHYIFVVISIIKILKCCPVTKPNHRSTDFFTNVKIISRLVAKGYKTAVNFIRLWL